MAEGYATSRPPVHPRVISQALQSLGWPDRVERALDVGCGAGLSTRALDSAAERCFGIEPAAGMLKWGASVAPRAHFAAAAAEALPVRDHSMDLITAAGSLNYVELDLFFPEAARVLKPRGLLIVYDFSPGCSFPYTNQLDEWFATFLQRYPPPACEGRTLNPEILMQWASGFEMQTRQSFEIGIPLTPRFYVDYMLTETNVAAAIREGVAPEDIRAWCTETLAPVWQGRKQEVLFRGYFACMANRA